MDCLYDHQNKQTSSNVEQNRTEEGQAPQWPMHFDQTDLCAVLIFMPSATPHFEQSAISCWQRCPHSHLVKQKVDRAAWILMWLKYRSHKTREAVSGACLHLQHSGLFTSSSIDVLLNESVLLLTPSLWVASFCSSWVILQLFYQRFFFIKALSQALSTNGLPILLMFPTHPVPKHSSSNLSYNVSTNQIEFSAHLFFSHNLL